MVKYFIFAVNQKQRSSEHSSLQNGGDEQYKLQSKSVTDGPGMELEMTDFDSDTDEELEMVTSNKGQSAMGMDQFNYFLKVGIIS